MYKKSSEVKYKYAKVQTNRVSLKRFMSIFQENISKGEICVAPRPKPGVMQYSYCAYLQAKQDSYNYSVAKKFKGYTELTKKKHTALVSKTKYSWVIQ